MAYNKISLDVNDRFLGNYEAEFFSGYKVLDDDADTAPFNGDQQKMLEYTLEAFEEAIEIVEMPVNSKTDLLSQPSDLKNKSPTLRNRADLSPDSRKR